MDCVAGFHTRTTTDAFKEISWDDGTISAGGRKRLGAEEPKIDSLTYITTVGVIIPNAGQRRHIQPIGTKRTIQHFMTIVAHSAQEMLRGIRKETGEGTRGSKSESTTCRQTPVY